MNTGIARVIGSKPQQTYYQQEAKWKAEVAEFITTPLDLVPDTLADPATGGTLTLTGALSAATVTTAEADIRHGNRVLEIQASQGEGTFFVNANLFEASGTNASQLVYTTGSITPSANVPVYIGINAAAGTPPNPTVTGAGLTWVSAGTAVVAAGVKLNVFRACGGSPSAGALTITYGVAPSVRCVWIIFEMPNAAPGGTDGSVAQVEGQSAVAATVALAKFRWADNATVGIAGRSNVAPPTAETGYTTIGSFGVGAGTSIMAEILPFEDLSPSAASADTFFGFQIQNAFATLNSSSTGGYGSLSVDLTVGDRIKQVDIQGRHVGAAGTFSASLWKVAKGTGVISKIGSTATSATGSTADQEIAISSLTETVSAAAAYWIEWTATSVADQRCYGASVTYDRLGP